MRFVDPGTLDLGLLFRNPSMFDTPRAWEAEGFQILNKSSNGKIMVASHPSVPGLLFKKYTSDVAQKVQQANFARRLEGAKQLRAFVAVRGLTRVVVPYKWVKELPRVFAHHAPVLIVEQLEVLGSEATVAAYGCIESGLLQELCRVLFHFRGMDSNAYNLPFLQGNRIGLVDTEHWDRSTRKEYLHHLGEHLSAESRRQAKRIFRELVNGGDGKPFKGGGAGSDASMGEDDSLSSSSSFSSSSSSSSSS